MSDVRQLPEVGPLSALNVIPASGTTSLVVVVCFVVAILAHCASPVRLTRVLVNTIAVTENIYFEVLERGLIGPSDALEPMLQLKVSAIRDESLDNSRSNWKEFCSFFHGRSVTIFLCIREVRDLGTRIEILKEAQLREGNLNLALGDADRFSSSTLHGKTPRDSLLAELDGLSRLESESGWRFRQNTALPRYDVNKQCGVDGDSEVHVKVRVEGVVVCPDSTSLSVKFSLRYERVQAGFRQKEPAEPPRPS
ncbi:hypothetical protein C8R47DRAFT_1275873 [Mycena vitilis]|nr:hypothetical protein C8R47DRAFT_1275873 [Mycena vitilis]